MFGCVRLNNVFRTPVKRDCTVRFLDTASHVSNNVAVSGRFIYFIQKNAIQVDMLSISVVSVKLRPASNLLVLLCPLLIGAN